jgi:hypothetical protein
MMINKDIMGEEMQNKTAPWRVLGAGIAAAMLAWGGFWAGSVNSQPGALTALDYYEITQLINRYAYGIDTCADNGYAYADVFTADGVFIDRNSDAGFAQGGRVLAQGREALAELVGGGSRGCKTKLVWTDWSHLMLNHEIMPSADGATGRVYLVQLGMDGPGSVARHGGYEDVYVKSTAGWRIKSRTHVRDKAWHYPSLQTPDLK